jgi:hypothetical protein
LGLASPGTRGARKTGRSKPQLYLDLKTDREVGLGEDHGAKAGEIQEKGVMCVKGRHGGVVEKVRIQGLATPGPGGCDGRFSRSKTGVEKRQGSRRENGLDPYYCS